MALLILLPIILITVTIHEVSHGWVAYLFGDNTAKNQGRLTFNPLAHIDFIGMVVVPLVLYFTIGIPFGWAKPVPVNPSMLRKPKRDMMFVGAAGPISNLIMALLGIFILKSHIFSEFAILMQVCLTFIYFNLAIASFNLIPIPPLDGSRVILGLLSRSWAIAYSKIEPYGMFIIIALIYVGFVRTWIFFGISFFMRLFGVGIEHGG